MRDRALSLMFAILALMLFAGLFIEPKPQLTKSMASTEDQGEQGLAALFNWLKLRELPVLSWRERWNELHSRYQSGHVLLTHYPFRAQEEKTSEWSDAPNAYINAQEKQAMIEWVASGNTLVMALGALDAEGNSKDARTSARQELGYLDFLGRIGWSLTGPASGALELSIDDSEDNEEDVGEDSVEAQSEQAGVESEAKSVAELEQEIASVNARPQALHLLELRLSPAATPLKFETKSWEAQGALPLAFVPTDSQAECNRSNATEDEQFDDDADAGDAESTEAAADENAVTEPDYSQDEIDVSGNTINPAELNAPICTPLGLQSAYVLLRSARDQSPAAWWLPFGRGGVVVLGYGSAWKNPNLSLDGSALAAETLLRNFLKPGGLILFDDYRYGLSNIYDPDALLKDPRLYKTLAIAAIFWLIYAVGRSRRLLPVRLPVARPTSATFAKAISDFYARQLSEPELAQALIAHFLMHAKRLFGVTEVGDAAIWARLQNEHALDRAALAQVQSLQSGADNVRLAALLTSLEQHLHSSK